MHLRRQVALLCTTLTLATAACSTTNHAASDDSPKTDTQRAGLKAPGAELPFPVDTRAVARIQLDALPDLVATTNRYRNSVFGSGTDAADDSPITAAPKDLAGHVTQSLVAGRPDDLLVHKLNGGDGGTNEPALSELDAERSIVVALSTRHNTDMLRELEYRTGFPSPIPPTGFSLRLFLPADDPGALLSEFERMCNGDSASCSRVVRTDTHQNWVLADIHFQSPAQSHEQVASTPDEDAWSPSENYFSRPTPSARAFFTNDAVLTIYGRPDDITAIGGVAMATEFIASQRRASPENQMYILAKYLADGTSLFELADPPAREYEDVTLQLDTSSDNLRLEAITSHTERGRAIAEATQLDTRLPTIRTETTSTALRLEYGFDPDAPLEAAAIPSAIKRALESDGMNGVAETMRTAGIWGWLDLVAGSPMALLKTADSSWNTIWARETGLSRPPWHQVHALRLAMGVRKHASTPTGFAPTGGIALLLDADSVLPEKLKRLATMVRQQTNFAIQIDREPRDSADRTVFTVGLGNADNQFGEPTAIAGGLSADLRAEHLTPLSDWIETHADSRSRHRGPSLPMLLWRTLQTSETLRFETAQSETATALRLAAGSDAPDGLSAPSSDAPVINPTAPPNCLQRAAEISREGLSMYASADNRATVSQRILSRLDSPDTQCDDKSAAETLRWIRGDWMRERALYAARAGRLDAAAETMNTACKLKGNADCGEADALATLASKFHPPTARPHRRRTSLNDLVYIDRQGPRRIETFAPAPLRTTDFELSISDIRRGDDDSLDALFSHIPDIPPAEHDGVGRSYPLAVDRTLDSELLTTIIRGADGRPTESDGFGSRRDAPVTAIALLVASGEAATSRLPRVLLRTPSAEAPDQSPRLQIVVGHDGLDVRSGDGAPLARLNDCSDDAPTHCVRNPKRVGKLVDQLHGRDLTPNREDEIADALAEQFRLESLPSRLANLETFDQPPAIDLSFRHSIPVSLVARLAGALGEYHRREFGNEMAPFIRLSE